MLTTTQELIQYLHPEEKNRNFSVLNAMVHTILSCGSEADAQALLPYYLLQPGNLDHAQILPVLMQYGNTGMAQKIYQAVTQHHRLKEGVDETVLQLFGKLKYEPARPLLIYYALEQEPYQYYLSQHAVLGLLHFNLTDLKPLIKSKIEKCYGQSLFPEFVPALVCKLDAPEQQDVLQKLYELGENTASTDCMGGIVLGFSLCGDAGVPYFWKVLFNPNWELGMSSTGARNYTYKAIQNLQITFRELYQKVKSIEDIEAQRYALDILLEMLEIKATKPLAENTPETITDILTLLYGWKTATESDNITDLAEKLEKSEEASRIESLLEQKLKEEMLYHNYLSLKKNASSTS